MPAEPDLASLARQHLKNAAVTDDDTDTDVDASADDAPPRKPPRTAAAAGDDDDGGEPDHSTRTRKTSSTAVRDFLRQHNFELDDDVTDDDLLPEIVDIHKTNQQLQKELEERKARDPYLNEYIQHRDDFQGFLKTREKPKTQADPEADGKPPKPKWDPPKYNPEWETRVNWDAKAKRFVPATQYDSPAVAEEANRWYAHQQAIQRRLAEDPFNVVREAGLEDYIQERLDALRKELTESVGTSIKSKSIDDEIDEYVGTKLFETDEHGRMKVQGKQPVLNAAGKAYQQTLGDILELLGAESFDKLPADQKVAVHKRAVRAAEAAAAKPPEKKKPGSNGHPNGAEKKPRFLDRLKKRSPNASGTISRSQDDDEPQNELSFEEMGMQELREMGALADKG